MKEMKLIGGDRYPIWRLDNDGRNTRSLGLDHGLLLLLSEKEEIRKIDSTEKWY